MRARRTLSIILFTFTASAVLCRSGEAQFPNDSLISPSRPVPTGKAPRIEVKLVKDSPEEKVYAIVFYKGDEALSGLTDFVLQNKIQDAHFTGIGAVNSATLAWLDPSKKIYRRKCDGASRRCCAGLLSGADRSAYSLRKGA
jgi:uncharacterized protein